MNLKTKIVCTIGPSTSSEEMLEKLIISGMNVARFNFSHANYDETKKVINILKKLREKLKVPLALMLDTKGPEIRIYGYKEIIEVKTKEKFFIQSIDGQFLESEKGKVFLEQNNFYETKTFFTNLPYIDRIVKIGDKILLMDGYFTTEVVGIVEDQTKKEKDLEDNFNFLLGKKIEIEFKNSGKLRPKAHLSIPNVDYPIEFLSNKDKEDIKFAVQNDFEYIALSFVRSSDDILKVKKIINEINENANIDLIAKIEHRKAIENIDDIIIHSDGIMVARGDLGVELPIEDVPVFQKKIIEKCYLSGKPVITATQMLESMIETPLPTRAEVSDVANAAYDMTSAVMLSGETAVGKFPELVVQTMKKILLKTESSIDYKKFLFSKSYTESLFDITNIISYNAVVTAYQCNAKAILCITKTGYAGRMISKLRPGLPIIVFTYDKKVYNKLALNWGVTPILYTKEDSFEKLIDEIKNLCIENNFVSKGDLVVIIAGMPLGKQGTTNMIRIESIGKSRIKGTPINVKQTIKNVVIIEGLEDFKEKDVDNKIVVLKNFSENYVTYLRFAAGIIIENCYWETQLKIVASAYNIPIIMNATGASEILKDRSLVEILEDGTIIEI
ncbi:MAG: pyruvate kinase [Spirochaetes bacterium]|nr:pyruvate kinase [Spirochaetota bacterium]